MVKNARVILCFMVLCCVLAEGRRHDMRNLRNYRKTIEQQQQEQQFEENLPRLFDDLNYDSRHRRHWPTKSVEDEESIEEVDTPTSPPRMEFDGDPDYYNEEQQEQVLRVPRRRLVHQKKHHHRHRAHHHKKPTLEDLNDKLYLEYDEGVDLSREKRHQRRRNWTEEAWKAFESSRRPELYDHDIHVFELEIRDAQNSSLCNYTVIPIPDPGGRVPRVLEHVKCNYVGNRCRERGSYCCVQTYRKVEVTYPGYKTEIMKVYSGCVCALQIYGTLQPYNPKLPLDD